MVKLPASNEYFNPTLQALHELGGSGHVREINDRVAAILDLTDEQLEKPFGKGVSNQTEIAYRLSYARSWLKKYGVIDNPSDQPRGVWVLTPEGQKTSKLDPVEVRTTVAEKERKRKRLQTTDSHVDFLMDDDTEQDQNWRDDLYHALQGMEDKSFERLCQRMLRKSGFEQVDVTGRTGDGGIDGIGVMRISGFLSFRVLFQCKRYKGSVSAGAVRDFRGAMIGRTDKGLIVTTGSFTQAAKREATRDGAPEIDLIDGEQLIDKLADLELGVKKEMVPSYTVIPDFFANI